MVTAVSGIPVTRRGPVCLVRPAGLAGPGSLSPRAVQVGSPSLKSVGVARKTGGSLVARAQTGGSEELDFDALLAKLSDKFDKAENKPTVIGIGVGALAAFFFVEWLIHLPVLDILLGFPAQLLGVLLGPYLLVRYLVDKEDIIQDVEAVVAKVVGVLPGQN